MKKLLSKKVLVVGVSVIVTCGLVFAGIEYTKYQESIKSEVIFKTDETINIGDDLMLLVDNYDADTISVVRVTNEKEEVVDILLPGKHTLVYEAVSNGHATEYTKTIEFVDNKGPVIQNTKETQEVEFGAEVDFTKDVIAEDGVDGVVEVNVVSNVDSKKPGTYTVEYLATDAAGNESKETASVTVKAPACAFNATWNESDCVCEKGYTGNGWEACKVVNKMNTASTTKNGSTGNKNSSNSESSSTGYTEGGNGGLSWNVDLASDEQINQAIQDGYNKYGDDAAFGGMMNADGTTWGEWNY